MRIAALSKADKDLSAVVSLNLIGCALVGSVWLAYFPLPILSYYKEWVFAMLLALAALVLPDAPTVRRRFAAEQLLVFVLLGIIGLQVLLGVGWRSQAMLNAGYLVFFLLAHDLGRRLTSLQPRHAWGRMAAFVTVACLGNCFFSAAQLNGWDGGAWPIFASRSDARIGGNLAQVNHSATLLWLGVVSAVGLWSFRQVSGAVAVAVVMLFCLFMIPTGSRMPLIVSSCVLVICLVLAAVNSDGEFRRVLKGLALAAIALPMSELAWRYVGVSEALGLSSGGDRMLHDVGNTAEVRMWLLRAAWDAVQSHPWLGIGPGKFAYHTWWLSEQIGRVAPNSSEINAHNLVAHSAAESGIVAGAAVFATLVVLVVKGWRCARMGALGALFSMAALVIFIHAMLEYPLSYSYFLGSLGLLLGAIHQVGRVAVSDGGGGVGAERSTRLFRVLAVVVLALGVVSHRLYAPLERALQEIVFQVSLGAVVVMQPDLEVALGRIGLWSPYRQYADVARVIATVPSVENVDGLITKCEETLQFGPSAMLLSRCSVSYLLAGKHDFAQRLAKSQCVMYPHTGYLTESLMTVVRNDNPAMGALRAACIRN